MTRESKVGLVVAGSFLCIVGGYLGLRMRSASTETPPDAATEVAATEAQPPESPPLPSAKLETVQAPQFQPPPVAVSVNMEPAAKMPDPVATVPAPVPSTFDFPGQSTAQPVETPKADVVKSPDPLPAMPEFKPQDPPKETPKPADVSVEFKPADVKQDAPKAIDPPAAPFVPVDVAPIVKDPPREEPKPIIVPKEEPKPVVVPKDEPKMIVPPAGSASLINDPVPPQPLPNFQPTSGTKPPVAKMPVSDSYLEEEYRLQAGDTFASVSKRFYMGDKYAMSLQQYNRDYPIGSPNLKLDPPRLAAGTVVWIPPLRVLEKRYPTLIADFKPLNTAAAPPATAASPSWTPAPARQVAATTKMYRVQDGGETMIDIARKKLNNPQAWNTIHQLNTSLNANANAPIPAGTILRIPGDARD